MLGILLKRFPVFGDYYRHIEKRKVKKRIEKLKKMSWEEELRLIEKTYNERIGHPLDWNNLQSYTEKMQWAKMFDTDIRKTQLSDKYAVRTWVADKIGEEHLIPLLGVWDCFDEIDFENLPNKFVLKTNNGSGTNLIVKDKSKLNIKRVRRLVKDWLSIDFAYYNPFEYQYSSIVPKIIAEKYMETDTGDLPDYKFLCFDGQPYFCWVDLNRYSNHKRNVYDMDWKLQTWNQRNYGNGECVPIPKEFDEMKRIATVLSSGFSHVRVDLYIIDGVVYFGEMTFTNGGGYEKIEPQEADLMLGNLWNIDTSRIEKGYKQ